MPPNSFNTFIIRSLPTLLPHFSQEYSLSSCMNSKNKVLSFIKNENTPIVFTSGSYNLIVRGFTTFAIFIEPFHYHIK